MRWVVVSLLVHAIVIAWLSRGSPEPLTEWHMPTLPAVAHVDSETFVELVETPAGGGGAGHRLAAQARTSHASARSTDAWEQITVGMEQSGSTGSGDGDGLGTGRGSGIGFGNGGRVHVATDVPAPPPPPPDPPVSKARPAKLIWPTRDEDVDDEGNLFVARVTVDTDGAVAGAQILTLRIGAKADHAANAIWSFRYEPALGDDGRPIRSTFEQSFQVR